MFSGRKAPPRDPVTLTLDGEAVVAERGEPIAVALLAADKAILARSPKLHRPRAPSCLRGGCDGCLARVDGVPNVMTCLVPARGGERVASQNVVGGRETDLLRVTDWFFPKGIDHHHLMAGVPGLGEAMQSFAQKVAGLGRIPSAVVEPAAGTRRDVFALVVGGGLAGITAASRLARAGKEVVLVDDGVALGGAALGAPQHLARVLDAEPLAGVEVMQSHVAGGVFDEIEGKACVVANPAAATVFHARALIFASGAHDGVVAVENNDLPGIFSARALCRLLAGGLVPDGPIGVVGAGFWADELARLAGSSLRWAQIDGFTGGSVVSGVQAGGARRKVAVVGVDAPPAPAFELAEQAGARIDHGPSGYRVVVDASGRAAEGAWAIGECTGAPFDPPRLVEQAARAADDVLATLR